jgi:hypothetical protein
LETRIQRLKEEYNIGVRNVDDYWGATIHLISFLNQENKDKQLSQNILKTILPDAVRVQKTKVYMYKQKNIH